MAGDDVADLPPPRRRCTRTTHAVVPPDGTSPMAPPKHPMAEPLARAKDFSTAWNAATHAVSSGAPGESAPHYRARQILLATSEVYI